MGFWRPVLPRTGSDGERTWQAALALAGALLGEAEADTARSLEPRDPAGAVLFACLARADPDPRWARAAVRRLNRAIDGADALCASGRWGLHGGLAGLGWGVEHVSRVLEAGAGELNADTDAALLRELQRGRWRGSLGLESGLVGLGVYFLERLPAASAIEGVSLVLAHLEALGSGSGARLDVARGIPGLLHFLGELAATGIEADRALRLSERCLAALRDQRDANVTDVGWCGELGTAAILFQVTRRTGQAQHRALAQRLLDRCLAWPIDMVEDVSLRRGAAGIAHTFNRVHQAEHDPRCLDAALRWLGRTSELLESGAAGNTLLDGRSGIALALLSATTAIEPAWDRPLLLSGLERTPWP
jgi:hypothetical protein